MCIHCNVRGETGNSAALVNARTQYFGSNCLTIPTLPFWTVYREQLVAPMFVFQVHDSIQQFPFCLFVASVVYEIYQPVTSCEVCIPLALSHSTSTGVLHAVVLFR